MTNVRESAEENRTTIKELYDRLTGQRSPGAVVTQSQWPMHWFKRFEVISALGYKPLEDPKIIDRAIRYCLENKFLRSNHHRTEEERFAITQQGLEAFNSLAATEVTPRPRQMGYSRATTPTAA